MEKYTSRRYFWGKVIGALTAMMGICLVCIFALPGMIFAQPDNGGWFDPDKSCSIKAQMPDTKNEQYKDMPATPSDLVFDLYKVADIAPAGSQNGYFAVTSDFQDISDNIEKLNNMDSLADDSTAAYASEYRDLAQLAIRLVKDSDSAIAPTVPGTKVDSVASSLNAGLYLVLVHTDDSVDYFIENDGVFSTVANTGTHEFMFLPELVSVPGRSDGVSNNTANRVPWQYDVTATLKPEWRSLYGSLEIVKSIDVYEMDKPATFVFQVEGTDDYGNVYSNTASIVFDGISSPRVVIDKIPAGMTVVITEVYSGASYSLASSAEQTQTIVVDETVSVDFSNAYNGSGNSGGSITNSFFFNSGDEDSQGNWDWSKNGEEQKR